MHNEVISQNSPVNPPAFKSKKGSHTLEKKIEKTTYRVKIHFSKTSKETMNDKIKRMLRHEIQET